MRTTGGLLSKASLWLLWAVPVFAQTEAAAAPAGWFNTDRVNALVLLLSFCAAVLLYIRGVSRGRATYIRPLPGLEAVEDGVGRATEMGRPVLFIPGTGDVDMAETLAGLAVLGRIAGITARYDTPLMVPCLYPMPLAAAGEVVRQAYADAGKAEAFRPDMVRYMAGESFGFSAVGGDVGASVGGHLSVMV